MTDRTPNHPEHSPKGYEWLPDAYARDVGPHSSEAREKVRQALAEGECKPLLRTLVGERHSIPIRMWDKEPVAKKVYPVFETGWMKMRLAVATSSGWAGPYVEGWVFVGKGALGVILGKVDPYHTGTPGRPSIKHLIDDEYQRRVNDGEARAEIGAEAQALHNWARKTHPSAQTPTSRTIENQIRSAFIQNRTK